MEKIKIAELEIDYKDLIKAQAELADGIRATKEDIADLTAQQKLLREEGRAGTAQYENNSKAIEQSKVVLAGLTNEYKNNERVLVSSVAAQGDSLGTIQKLEARNKELRASLRSLNLETEEGKKQQKAYILEINKNTEKIRDNSDAYVQQKMNIGNYKSAFDLLPGSLKNVASSAQATGAAFKALAFNPLGIAIVAIAGALMGLVKIFKTFDPIIDKLEHGMAALGAVFKFVQTGIIGLITGQKGHNETMREAIDLAVELKRAEQDLYDQQQMLIVSDAKSKRQIDELLLQSKDRTKSEKERQALIDQALEIEKKQYQERKKIADLELEIAQNKIISGRNLNATQIKLLKEEGVAYAIRLKDTKAITDEEIEALAAALAQQENILNESVAIREKAINRQNVLIEKQEEAYAKAVEARKERDKETIDALLAMGDAEKAYFDSQLAAAESEMLAEVELEKQKIAEKERLRLESIEKEKQWNEELAAFRAEKAFIDADNERIIREVAMNDRFQAELDALAREQEAEIQAALKTGASVSLITKKYAEIEKVIEREKQKAKLDIIGSFAGSLAQLFGEETKLGKAAAITQTVINTYKGAMAAFAETPGGVIIKSAAAATAVVAGIAAVKNIVKAGGGGGGGASIADLPGSGGVGTEVGVSPNINNINATASQPVLVLEEFQFVQGTQVKVKAAGEL